MANAEKAVLLKITALDEQDHSVSIDHRTEPEFRGGYGSSSTGFPAHTIEVTDLLDHRRDGSYMWALHHDGKQLSGGMGLGGARRHELHVSMFGVGLDEVELDSDVFEAEQLRFEYGDFVAPFEKLFDRRLILPLYAGQITVDVSILSEFMARRLAQLPRVA